MAVSGCFFLLLRLCVCGSVFSGTMSSSGTENSTRKSVQGGFEAVGGQFTGFQRRGKRGLTRAVGIVAGSLALIAIAVLAARAGGVGPSTLCYNCGGGWDAASEGDGEMMPNAPQYSPMIARTLQSPPMPIVRGAVPARIKVGHMVQDLHERQRAVRRKLSNIVQLSYTGAIELQRAVWGMDPRVFEAPYKAQARLEEILNMIRQLAKRMYIDLQDPPEQNSVANRVDVAVKDVRRFRYLCRAIPKVFAPYRAGQIRFNVARFQLRQISNELTALTEEMRKRWLTRVQTVEQLGALADSIPSAENRVGNARYCTPGYACDSSFAHSSYFARQQQSGSQREFPKGWDYVNYHQPRIQGNQEYRAEPNLIP